MGCKSCSCGCATCCGCTGIWGTCFQTCDACPPNCGCENTLSDEVCMDATWYIPNFSGESKYTDYDYFAIKFEHSIAVASSSDSDTAYNALSWYYGLDYDSPSDVTTTPPSGKTILNATTFQNAFINFTNPIIWCTAISTVSCTPYAWPENPY